MNKIGKEYLADGVYVDVQRGMLVLTTENGINVTNTIYLDAETLGALEAYIDKLKKSHIGSND